MEEKITRWAVSPNGQLYHTYRPDRVISEENILKRQQIPTDAGLLENVSYWIIIAMQTPYFDWEDIEDLAKIIRGEYDVDGIIDWDNTMYIAETHFNYRLANG